MSSIELQLMSNNELCKELGKKIKLNRIAKNYSQEELALNCGISKNSIKNIENGISSLDSLMRVINYLGLTENLLNVFIVDKPKTIEEIKKNEKTRQRVRK